MPSQPTEVPDFMGPDAGMGADMGMDAGVGGGAMPEQSFGQDPMGADPMGGGMEPENQFDTNFDAGVEADEETDPKRYIQQLTGKLSQSLRSYNEGLPQPDADLSKYVAGMILKQASEGLGQKDVKEILDKMNGNGEEDEPQDDGMTGDIPMGESVNRVGGIGDDEEAEEKADKIRQGGSGNASRRPFLPKKFSR